MMAATQKIKHESFPMAESRRKLILLLSCILLLAQAVPLIHTRWVEDESFYAAPADALVRHGEIRIRQFAPPGAMSVVDTRPPLPTLLMAGAFKLFGTNLYAAKLPHVLAALAGVPLIYLLGCELGGVLLGLGAALFLAADNTYFLASRTVRPEAFVASFSVAGLLLFLYSLRRGSTLFALLGGLLVGIGVLGHPNAFAAATSAGIFALAEFGVSIFRRARPYAFVAGLLLPILAFVAWGMSTPVRRVNFIRTYTEGEGQPLSRIPELELSRYKDFIGMASTRFSLPVPIPYRLHVVLAIFAAFGILFRWNRRLFWQVLALIAPCMAWWAFIRFESVRYTATAAPYLGPLFAGAVIALWERRPAWRRQVTAVAALFIAIEVASNYGVLLMYRKGDYHDVRSRLEALVPPNAGAYGAFTFWMALNDHPYFSWNRAPLQYAIDHGARYLILNDRVLLHGSGFGQDDWVHVRKATAEFIRSGGATLVGHAPNPFYGDLEVYRVNLPDPR